MVDESNNTNKKLTINTIAAQPRITTFDIALAITMAIGMRIGSFDKQQVFAIGRHCHSR
ncbi:MAG TPA: hypothetical protein VKA91_06600 [Nitrososphaeraceae archaeon]|nr:hypothetical protein [Nitrososphaeraceae archaeon]